MTGCASFFPHTVATVQNLLDILEEISPAALASGWDNIGLLLGSPQSRVSSVILALDSAAALTAEAASCGAELIITHHPAIFHPLKSLRTDQPGGSFLAAALRAGISVIGCHTNFDAACGGVNDVLAEALGLLHVVPLAADEKRSGCGMGRIGILPEPLSAEDFLDLLHARLEFPWLLEAGARPASIAKVALCGGSGSDLAELASAAGADVFLTAEIKHNVARWAEDAGLWLLDGGHFATENPAMRRLADLLAAKTRQAGLDVRLHLAEQKPPLTLAH